MSLQKALLVPFPFLNFEIAEKKDTVQMHLGSTKRMDIYSNKRRTLLKGLTVSMVYCKMIVFFGLQASQTITHF